MAITFSCKCGKTVQVSDDYAGQEGQCPSCGRAVQIPEDADGRFTGDEPRPKAKTQSSDSAPWLAPPRTLEPPPDPDEGPVHLTTHAGQFITDEDDFFVEAPPEIGKLYSAFTSLKRGVEPMSLAQRSIACLATFGIAFLLTASVIAWFKQGGNWRFEDLMIVVGAPALFGLILVLIVLWWTGFSHTCTYVGTKGVAKFTCSGDRDNISQSEIFHFRDATELRIAQTRHYYNGAYTGTDYAFTWTDDKAYQIYQIAGRYSSEEGNPVATDPYYFALMAETAWTMHLFHDIERATAGDELLFFGLKGGDYIQLGEGLLILQQGGKTLRLRGDQIQKMTIGDGVISVWEHGAQEGWFTNSGIHTFMYHDLGNARFFMFALDKLLGIRF